MNQLVKVIVKHPNGYIGILYGESSMVIHNPEGNEVMHTGSTGLRTEKELYAYLEKFPEVWGVIRKMLEEDECDLKMQ